MISFSRYIIFVLNFHRIQIQLKALNCFNQNEKIGETSVIWKFKCQIELQKKIQCSELHGKQA